MLLATTGILAGAAPAVSLAVVGEWTSTYDWKADSSTGFGGWTSFEDFPLGPGGYYTSHEGTSPQGPGLAIAPTGGRVYDNGDPDRIDGGPRLVQLLQAPGTTRIKAATFDHVDFINADEGQVYRLALYGSGGAAAGRDLAPPAFPAGVAVSDYGPISLTPMQPADSAQLWLFTICGGSGPPYSCPFVASPFRSYGHTGTVALTLTDPEPPALQVDGPLAAAGGWTNGRGQREITLGAADPGSGVESLLLTAKSPGRPVRTVAADAAPCDPRHTIDQPAGREAAICPDRHSVSALDDLTRLPEGGTVYLASATDLSRRTASRTWRVDVDRTAPVAIRAGGPLLRLGGRWTRSRATRPLTVAARDARAGVAAVSVTSTGPGGPRRLGTATHPCASRPASACPHSWRAAVPVDLDGLPDGIHHVTVTATDRAGNFAGRHALDLRLDRAPAPPPAGRVVVLDRGTLATWSRAQDPGGSGIDRYRLRLTAGDGSVVLRTHSAAVERDTRETRVFQPSLRAARATLTVRDRAGNESSAPLAVTARRASCRDRALRAYCAAIRAQYLRAVRALRPHVKRDLARTGLLHVGELAERLWNVVRRATARVVSAAMLSPRPGGLDKACVAAAGLVNLGITRNRRRLNADAVADAVIGCVSPAFGKIVDPMFLRRVRKYLARDAARRRAAGRRRARRHATARKRRSRRRERERLRAIRHLVSDYAPTLFVDRDDGFWPIDVNRVFQFRRPDPRGGGHLYTCLRPRRRQCGRGARTSPRAIGGGQGEGTVLDWPAASDDSGEQERMFRAAVGDAPGESARVYFYPSGPLVHGRGSSPGLFAMQYWFFYSYNYYERLGARRGRHEGDLEHVAVLFSRSTLRPVYVYMARHEHEDRVFAWDGADGLQRHGTHLRLFPAKGSHATYERCGKHARPLSRPQRVLVGRDHSTCDVNALLHIEGVGRLMRLATEPWACWRGRLGESGPKPGLPWRDGDGPEAPLRQQKAWWGDPCGSVPVRKASSRAAVAEAGRRALRGTRERPPAAIEASGPTFESLVDGCDDWRQSPTSIGATLVACDESLLRHYVTSGFTDPGPTRLTISDGRVSTDAVPPVFTTDSPDALHDLIVGTSGTAYPTLYAAQLREDGALVEADFTGIRLDPGTRARVELTSGDLWTLVDEHGRLLGAAVPRTTPPTPAEPVVPSSRAPRLRAPTHVRARRAGNTLTVTWRGREPRATTFFVTAARQRRGLLGSRPLAERRPHRRSWYRARIRLGAWRPRYVAVTATDGDRGRSAVAVVASPGAESAATSEPRHAR